ncbi:uncharacterized protein [Leptinotarsa decemlineata]|uniref:uncharacterized protein n=1 Tax=Leptinotarsa decemlineata TaxID=7539 RepID=UPI003D305E54
MTAKLKIVQFNADRRRDAHNLLKKIIQEKEIDIALIQEPNMALTTGNPRWILDESGTTAVLCENPRCGVTTHETGQNFICIVLKDWSIYNCYISPNIPMNEFRNRVDNIMEHVRDQGKEALIVGDFNAKSALWSSPMSDARGEYLVEWINALNISVCNEGNIPTFVRGAQTSFIDVTLATQDI